jgi:hypothetical protein
MSSASRLRQLLQSHPNAPVVEQGLAGVARHRVIRSHSACANSRRIAPPIRQDLVSDRDNPRPYLEYKHMVALLDPQPSSEGSRGFL